MALKIKKGDQVQVIAGKDVGAQGRVLQVIPRKQKVLVEGVNQVTRHERVRMNRKGGQEGGITHKEAPISLSNIALLCPTDGATRVGYRIEENGAKVRVCVKCGTEL
jgi:large subunit ribosomal protein L24